MKQAEKQAQATARLSADLLSAMMKATEGKRVNMQMVIGAMASVSCSFISATSAMLGADRERMLKYYSQVLSNIINKDKN